MNASHIPLQLREAAADGGDAANLLDSRLRDVPAIQSQESQKLLRNFLKGQTNLDNQDLSKKLAVIRKQLGTTKGLGQESLKDIEGLLKSLEAYTGHKFDPQDTALQDMVKRFAAKPALAGDSQPGFPPRGAPDRTPSKPREPSRPPSHLPLETPPPPAPEGRQTTALAKWLAEGVERIKPGPALTNSPAWKQMTESLNRYKLAGDASFRLDSADSLFRRWGLDSSFNKLFSPAQWSFRPQLPTPSLPNVANWLPSFGPGGPIGTGVPSLSGATPGGLWRGLLWIAVLLILAGAGWLVLTRRRRAVAEAADRAAHDLGPWPIPPDRVRTAAELVRAFEYLSLLILGSPARNWNHRHIAVALADTTVDAERRRAAFALATAYEHARYAPAGYALSTDELGAARENLCLLAGAPSA